MTNENDVTEADRRAWLFPETRKALWRLKLAWLDYRYAAAESKYVVAKWRFRIAKLEHAAFERELSRDHLDGGRG